MRGGCPELARWRRSLCREGRRRRLWRPAIRSAVADGFAAMRMLMQQSPKTGNAVRLLPYFCGIRISESPWSSAARTLLPVAWGSGSPSYLWVARAISILFAPKKRFDSACGATGSDQSSCSAGSQANPKSASLNRAASPVICLRRSISSSSIPRCFDIHASERPSSWSSAMMLLMRSTL